MSERLVYDCVIGGGIEIKDIPPIVVREKLIVNIEHIDLTDGNLIGKSFARSGKVRR